MASEKPGGPQRPAKVDQCAEREISINLMSISLAGVCYRLFFHSLLH